MIIGVDLDEILSDFINPFIEFYNKKNGSCFQRKEIFCYEVWKVWGKTPEKIMEEIYNFYNTTHFKNIKPIPGSIEGIDVLNLNHELKIITSRQNEVKQKTKNWIKKHFPNKFSKVHFANHFALSGERIEKSEICLKENIDIMIEDSLIYATDCALKNIEVLLLDCPWNKSNETHKNISRVFSWKEIVKKITEMEKT